MQVKHSSAALFNYLKSINNEQKLTELKRICDDIVDIFTQNQLNDRVTVPMFGFLDRLLNSGCISVVLQDTSSTFAMDIFNLLKTEINDCKNTYKLIDSINVMCQLIQVSSLCNLIFIQNSRSV